MYITMISCNSLLFPCVSSVPQLCHHSRARPLTVNNQAADPPSHSPSIQIQSLPCFVEKFNLERLMSWIGIQNQDVGNRFSFSSHLPVQQLAWLLHRRIPHRSKPSHGDHCCKNPSQYKYIGNMVSLKYKYNAALIFNIWVGHGVFGKWCILETQSTTGSCRYLFLHLGGFLPEKCCRALKREKTFPGSQSRLTFFRQHLSCH